MQVVAEELEIAALGDFDPRRLRRRAARLAAVHGDAVGVLLLPELALRERGDRVPQALLERTRPRRLERERCPRVLFRPQRAPEHGGEVRGPGRLGRVLGEVREPLVEARALRGAQERARVRRRERPAEELAGFEQLARVEARGELASPALAREERCGLAVAVAREETRGEGDRRSVASDRLGGDIAEQPFSQGGAEGRALLRVRVPAGDERQVPEELALPRAHRRIEEAVAEAPPSSVTCAACSSASRVARGPSRRSW